MEVLQFSKEEMFQHWRQGKIFTLESPKQSGETPHEHDYDQFWYVERGNCEHCIEGQTHRMNAGDIFILPPGITHQTTLGENSKIICVEFALNQITTGSGVSFYRQLNETMHGMSFEMLFRSDLEEARGKFQLSLNTRQRIEDLLYLMLEEYEKGELLYEDYLQLLTLELLLLLIREYALLPKTKTEQDPYAFYRETIKRAVHYVDVHYAEPLTLLDMCQKFALSKTYFCYLFKAETQETFTNYLTQRRIEAATQDLLNTNLRIHEISERSGFTDPSHFSRTFKKHMGLAPSKFRQSHQTA